MFSIVCFSLAGLGAPVSPGSVEAARLNNVGVAYMNQEMLAKALEKFEQAHAADPASAIPVLNKGIALLYLEKLSDAEQALKQAAALDPANPRMPYCLGLVHIDAGNPLPAVDDFKRAIQLDPGDADSHYFLGTLYLGEKQYDQAIDAFESTLRISPLHASAHFGLAKALQRAGRMDESRQQFARFQKITQTKVGSPLTAAYGEQGRYAKAEDMLFPPSSVEAMIPVKFVRQSFAGQSSAPAVEASAEGNDLGGGACILPVEGAGEDDIVAMSNGDHAIRVYKLLPDGKAEEIPEEQTGLAVKGRGIACAVGDYDGDGLPDLAVAVNDRVMLFHNLGHGKFADTTAQAGIGQLNRPAGLTFIDFDHDGDVDLFVTGSTLGSGSGPNVLWRNNGNSTFTEWTGPTGLSGNVSTTGATLTDINNDRAVDLVVTGAGPSPVIFQNEREGAFKELPVFSEAGLAPTRGVAVFDFNKDGWMDVVVTHAGAPGVSLWRNVDGHHFERVPLPLPGVTGAWGVAPIDIDNDGWIDLAIVVETANGAELRILRNRGKDGFEDVSRVVGLDKLSLRNPRSVIVSDINGDGAADLVVAGVDGLPAVLLNVGGGRNHSLRIALKGLADNKTALGTKVEVFAGGQWQKFEITGASGYLGQSSPEILAGLGQENHVDVVHLLWPTGVPQDEIDVPVGSLVKLTELDRRGSSCPVLFAWDGKHYRFISDVIGAAVIGHWVSPEATNRNDPDEWIKIDGDNLQARDGYLSLRFGEPMEEINFIDQLRLVAVDHPEGTEVYPDERFLSEPPFASGRTVVASAETRLPAGAWDDQGHDVLGLLSHVDHRYVRDFNNLSYAGFADMHALTLDLGTWSPHRPLRLFMRGFIEYFSASSMYAAWQAGIRPIPPSVEAEMPDGSWKKVIDDMGFPAGLPRTIVVDLTDKLPAGTRRIRIKTNLQIYWDQVLVDNGPDSSANARETELPLAVAHLAFRGYPQQVDSPKTPGDLTYNYDRISATGPFDWQRGSYTKYGEVTPLLRRVDDKYVIFGSGEEIDAEFRNAALPPLPAHWKRDYFFYANGFVKDMDFYEASPFTVAQMPFHGMTTYPYSANQHYPEDPKSIEYQLEWNDRFESGNRTQQYRFNYQPAVSEPSANLP